MANIKDNAPHPSDEGLSTPEPMDLSYCPPPQPTKVLVVDLDETLILYAKSLDHIHQFDEKFVLKRPYADKFLSAANAKGYLVVCWTAAMQPYADAVLNCTGLAEKINHCLYRQACSVEHHGSKIHYIKDISRLETEMEHIKIVDNRMEYCRGGENQSQRLYISTWRGNQDDKELNLLTAEL